LKYFWSTSYNTTFFAN